jgi:type IV pilus assembly protein PilB
MTDIDAIRWLASERDLEFVDLDTYGVDPSAGEILPADVARAHHMVAVKRKFGTPVIATSDPDDISARDSVRAEIGRDFISVVASKEQIGEWIDRLFTTDVTVESNGVANEALAPSMTERDDTGPSTSAGLLEAMIEELAVATSSDELPANPLPEDDARPQETLVDEVVAEPVEATVDVEPAEATVADETVEAAAPVETEEAVESLTSAEDSEPAPVADPVVTAEPENVDEADRSEVAEAPATEAAPARGRGVSKRRSKKTSRKETPAVPESDESATEPLDEGEAAGVEPGASDVEGELAAVESHESADSEPIVATPDSPSASDDVAAEVPVETEAARFEPPPESDADTVPLEPATSLLPTFGFAEPRPDEAEVVVAERVDADSWAASTGSDAADLMAEAVASFEEHRWEGQFEDSSGQGSPITSAHPPLAKALLDGERVSPEDMREVLEEHDRTGQSIARILTAKKLVTEADLMWGMAQEMGLEFVDLDIAGVDYAQAGLLPEATARHHNVIVIGNDEGTPVVAASNPTDVFAMDDLRTIMGRNFNVVVATRSQISGYLGRIFNSGDAADIAAEASVGMDGSTPEQDVEDIQAITEDAPIVRYVNLLILQALNERASDIHVEPTGSELRIRYRIDGVLHDVSTGPRAISAAVITRLKVMADMNVAEHRIPQDGRISLNVGNKGIDLRIATLPTIHGEKVVMRVLDKSSVVLGFGDLGFSDELQSTYENIYTKPYGTILVTGPTGSGKSTTLYTTLTALNSPEKNIITVEDPVELQLKGVNQVQLNIKAGLTFASALKSILRSDPDIVLVGEIRDKETALIAIEAALTGHLVLATLHTNNAASTPMRLVEMGLEPFLVTSSLSGVLAQRLARRLCTHCKEAYEPTEAEVAAAGWSAEEVQRVGGIDKVFRAVGCSACSNTGYRGRKALAELMPMSEEIERMIIEGGSVDDIHRLAVSQGMTTLRESGLRKAIEGETTLEEVLRVVA